MAVKAWRFAVVVLSITVAVGGMVWRLVDLAVVNRPFLLKESQARILRKVTLPAYRGMILDRMEEPLAVSIPVFHVWVNPHEWHWDPTKGKQLAQHLGISVTELHKKIAHGRARSFVYLKRGVSEEKSEAIKALNWSGLYLERSYRRYYPEERMMAPILGLTNIDDLGQEGLELAYNRWLQGIPGESMVIQDRLAEVVAELGQVKTPQQGHDLVLSIDHRIQYASYRALSDALTQFHAKSGSVVVLNVKTGEILAMANAPSTNPNRHEELKLALMRNRAATDVFEPGSVIKPFTIAFALQSGRYSSKSTIDTNPGWMTIGGYRIRDHMNYGVMNLTQVLQKSSNIASAKILFSLKTDQYLDFLRSVGFGDWTDSGFPGEARGQIHSSSRWEPSEVATIAYGYGLSVTALQLAEAYAVLATGGVKRPMTLLKQDTIPVGERVMPEAIAQTVVHMMESVVQEGGTGTRADVPGYRVAGKTGTAYISNGHGYDADRYIASFAGMIPANRPELVVVVVMREPQLGVYYGGLVAAPVFAEVASAATRLMNISP